jgi:hypothetical protein
MQQIGQMFCAFTQLIEVNVIQGFKIGKEGRELEGWAVRHADSKHFVPATDEEVLSQALSKEKDCYIAIIYCMMDSK